MEFKNCIINTHGSIEICRRAVDMLVRYGYDRLHAGPYDGIVAGKWANWCGENSVLHGTHEHHVITKPDWPVFDAATELDKLERFLRGEPEFDETPLPNTMDKETEDRIRRDFNLSPDQWEMMTPMVRAALAGAEIKIEKKTMIGTMDWLPLDPNCDDAQNGNTVMLTNDPRQARNDAEGHVAIGFHDDTEWKVIRGPRDFRPTHYCSLPYVAETDDDE